MTGRMHFIGGVAIGTTTTYYILQDEVSIFPLLTGTIIGGIAGLLPDIDNKQSMITSACPKISKVVRKVTKHRGITHSLVIPFLVALFTCLLYKYTEVSLTSISVILSFIMGYLMHLVQDTLTMGGVPWLYPISFRKQSLLAMKSGNRFESVLTLLLIFGYVEVLNRLFIGEFIMKF